MVIHSIIGEYDIMYAQKRELTYACEKSRAGKFFSSPVEFLQATVLPVLSSAKNINEKRNYYDYY